MEFTFHENPYPGSPANTIAVFHGATDTRDADELTADEVNRMLMAMNSPVVVQEIIKEMKRVGN